MEILTGLAFKGDVVTTGQNRGLPRRSLTLGPSPSHCLPTTRSTTGNWFTPRSALLRAFQIYWSGYTDSLSLQEPMTLIVYSPALHRFLTSTTVHQLMSNHVDEEKKVEALPAFNRLYLDHCWTTGALKEDLTLSSIESRTGFGIQLPFTAKDLIESLQVELNCNKIFGLHYRGLVGHCILTVSQLQLMYEDVSNDCSWQSLFTDEPLPRKNRWSRLPTAQEETDRADYTAKVDVKITGLPVGTEEVTVTVTGH